MLRVALLIFSLSLPAASHAQNGPILVDPSTGKYLGNLNSNRFDPNSVANPYGRFGSRYSPDSINNPYGRYGSPFSPNSARNPYTNQGPIIIRPYGSGFGFGN